MSPENFYVHKINLVESKIKYSFFFFFSIITEVWCRNKRMTVFWHSGIHTVCCINDTPVLRLVVFASNPFSAGQSESGAGVEFHVYICSCLSGDSEVLVIFLLAMFIDRMEQKKKTKLMLKKFLKGFFYVWRIPIGMFHFV